MTKPQDLVVALTLALRTTPTSYAELGKALGMSASEVHGAVRRLESARLVDPDTRQVRRKALKDFLLNGVAYIFPADLGTITRGIPTAWAAPILTGKIQGTEPIAPVWSDPEGTVTGAAVEPLYPSVPGAARRNPALYDLLALIDLLRLGHESEGSLVGGEIERLLSVNQDHK